MSKIRIGIVGYGNLGRGVEASVKLQPDMELIGVFSRRKGLETVSGVPTYTMEDLPNFKGKIDVMVLCGGSATDLIEQTRANIAYYKENARIIKEGLESIGLTVYGGVDAPYIWLKTPGNMTSWELFDILLEQVQIVSTPGSGFGPHGEGYLRLTAFGSRENTIRAVERIKTLKF